uniref:hypothetical protein n=1 Tax=Cephaloticoccus sp. TaxID=1985742 RepID=UPI0040497937
SLRSAYGLPPRGIANATLFRHINQHPTLTLPLAQIPRPRHEYYSNYRYYRSYKKYYGAQS